MKTENKPYWASLEALESWLLRTGYRAYDPFDGLSSYLRVFTLWMKFPQQVLQQFVRRNPVNVRPYIGIKPHTSTKGMGFLAGGYLMLYQLTGEEQHRQKAVSCYAWLMENYSRGYSGYCWGNAFDYISRGFYLPKGAPTVVWSGLIGHQFIEAYRLLGDKEYLRVAKSVGDFILHDLPRIQTPYGTCISYVCHSNVGVHNANFIGARLLAEVYKETSEVKYLELAAEAIRYGTHFQLPTGAWYYGEAETYHWIDNWHTAYNLDALLEYGRNTGTREFDEYLMKGLNFFVDHFFRSDGAPKYYWDRDYKYDIQSSAQAIDTLLLFGRNLGRADLTDLAKKVARWTIANMQDESGYFYLWKNKWFTNKTPTFHWGGTTMFHALSHLLLEIEQ